MENISKEPWQLTREDYLNKNDNFPELPARVKIIVGGGFADFDYVVGDWHRKFVMEAIKESKPVPSKVLADYPELAKAEGKC